MHTKIVGSGIIAGILLVVFSCDYRSKKNSLDLLKHEIEHTIDCSDFTVKVVPKRDLVNGRFRETPQKGMFIDIKVKKMKDSAGYKADCDLLGNAIAKMYKDSLNHGKVYITIIRPDFREFTFFYLLDHTQGNAVPGIPGPVPKVI